MGEHMFKRYDSDGDGLLSFRDVKAFIKGEYNLELPEEKLCSILGVDSLAKFTGVQHADFHRFVLLVGVASVAGALDGVEVEVVKAEEKARPLSAKGPVRVPLRQLPEAVGQLDAAIDVAKDYLAAARDQIKGM